MRKVHLQLLALAATTFLFPTLLQAQGFPGSIRISTMGMDGTTNIDAFDPAVAYNATDDEYMVVWSGDTIPSEDEIWGQRMDAATGAFIGGRIRISYMGGTGATAFDGFAPAIAWNSNSNEYLVVWSGDDDTGNLINSENEIFGQRLSNTGQELGADDFRISTLGPTGNGAFDAFDVDVAFNSTNSLYLVAWSGDSTDGEDEIQGQLVAANGALTGSMLTISNQGPSGNTSYDAEQPAIAYNATDNEFMVIWWGDTQVPGEEECYARRLAGATGAPLDSARAISDMGPNGDVNYDATTGDVAWNSDLNQYLVVWDADDSSGVTISGENEIFGQLLDNAGQEIGPNDFVISSLGTNLDGASDGFDPQVVYSPNCQEYIVTYEGDNINGSTVDGEVDCFIARIAPNGTPTGIDSAVTNAGVIGSGTWDTGNPAIAFSTVSNTYLIVNHGEHNAGMLADGENEIWGILKGCCSAPAFPGMAYTDTVCNGSATTLTTPINGSTDSLKWECSTDSGATWTFLSAGATWQGVNTDSLTFFSAGAQDGNQYRLVGYACGDSSRGPIITILVDPIGPSITCPANITETPTTLNCLVPITWVPPVPVDNCSGASASGSSNPGDSFPVGTTTVTYTALDGNSNMSTCSFTVTVDTPMVPGTITYTSGNLCTSMTGPNFQYQWLQNGNTINGATSPCYFPTTPGDYTVLVTDANGCTGIADTTLTVVGRSNPLSNVPDIFPNPTTGQLQVRFETAPLTAVALRLTDLRGKEILSATLEHGHSTTLDLGGFANGVYFLHIESAESRIVRKVQLAR